MLNRQKFKYNRPIWEYNFEYVERRLRELSERCKTDSDFTVKTAVGTACCYVTYFSKQEIVATQPSVLYNMYLMKQILAAVVLDELDLSWVTFKP